MRTLAQPALHLCLFRLSPPPYLHGDDEPVMQPGAALAQPLNRLPLRRGVGVVPAGMNRARYCLFVRRWQDWVEL